MLFNSLEFLVFFPTVVVLFFAIPHRNRWLLLLLASYGFYMAWKPAYILLIIASTLIDYYCGLKMGSLEQKEQRKPYLWLSLASNLGILFLFKYFNFFNESGRDIAVWLGLSYNIPVSELILPMGISFYTFQTMSYSIDIYNGKLKPERHLGVFALFVSFFPQLVAGPIERASSLLPQFKQEKIFDYDRIVSGLLLMAWGFFKKVVIADRLALFVNSVYATPQQFEGPVHLIATLFFAFQIYCDFSGYSDIAIGSARVLGFDLMKNFQTPYFSQSIGEFWRRWHISLSTWFKDYVYIPLGGNRVLKWRWYYNLFITFLVSGLWHGASWTFVMWGVLHGIYLVAGILTKPWRNHLMEITRVNHLPKLQKTLNILFTFCLVCVAWVFFRANNLGDALYILDKSLNVLEFKLNNLKDLAWAVKALLMGEINTMFILNINFQTVSLGISVGDFVLSFCLIILLLTAEYLNNRTNVSQLIRVQRPFIRYSVYYSILVAIVLLGVFTHNEFIYFQF